MHFFLSLLEPERLFPQFRLALHLEPERGRRMVRLDRAWTDRARSDEFVLGPRQRT